MKSSYFDGIWTGQAFGFPHDNARASSTIRLEVAGVLEIVCHQVRLPACVLSVLSLTVSFLHDLMDNSTSLSTIKVYMSPISACQFNNAAMR